MPLAIDATPAIVGVQTGTTVTTGTFSTTTANEILVAFLSNDGFGTGVTTFSGVTDTSGMTWTLARRTNTQNGTAEIWYALATAVKSNITVTATSAGISGDRLSIQVVTLTGHDTFAPIGNVAGANAANAGITGNVLTTRANSWVFAVASDNNVNQTTTVGSGQTKIAQDTVSATRGAGTTFRQTALTTGSGTSVTMNITAPASTAYNMAIVELREPFTAPTERGNLLFNFGRMLGV